MVGGYFIQNICMYTIIIVINIDLFLHARYIRYNKKFEGLS